MLIEYVLIEKQDGKKRKPDKKRIRNLLKKEFDDISTDIIFYHSKRKEFELPYRISCCPTTESNSTDNVYNVVVESNHSNKRKSAELLESVHLKFIQLINEDEDYHVIVAKDELAEYFCNLAYPKFQHFERELRHLIFKVVTKAYGNLWTKETLPDELKKKLKDDIKARIGSSKEDILIEQALHEMTLSQLVDYLFYGPTEMLSMSEYIDEHFTFEKLNDLSKEELILLIEKVRRKSVWNLFLAKDIDVDEPQSKFKYLRSSRNKVAHCKQFYSEDYCKSIEYIDLFIPKIEVAIDNASITDPLTVEDLLIGFNDYTMELTNLATTLGQIISPAIREMAEMGASVSAALIGESVKDLKEVLGQTMIQNLQIIKAQMQVPIIDQSIFDSINVTRNIINNINTPLLLSDSLQRTDIN